MEQPRSTRRWTKWFAYAFGLIFAFLVLIPAVTFDNTSERNNTERGQWAWFIKQRACKPVSGKDVKWYGGTSHWKCADGTVHESRFGHEEVLKFSNMTIEDLILYNAQVQKADNDGFLAPIIEFLRGTFRVNSNTLILLIILVQVTSVNYRLRK